MYSAKRGNRAAAFMLVMSLALSMSAGIILMILGASSDTAQMYTVIITSLSASALPVVFYLGVFGMPIQRTLRLYKISKFDTIATLILTVFLMVVVNWIGALAYTAFPIPDTFFSGLQSTNVFLTIIGIAILPGIFEESIFRGIMTSHYGSQKLWTTVLISSLLFGLLHMNAFQASYAIVLGIFFNVLNHIVGSVLPSMIIHALNNTFSGVADALTPASFTFFTILAVVSLVISLFILYVLARYHNNLALIRRNATSEEFFNENDTQWAADHERYDLMYNNGLTDAGIKTRVWTPTLIAVTVFLTIATILLQIALSSDMLSGVLS